MHINDLRPGNSSLSRTIEPGLMADLQAYAATMGRPAFFQALTPSSIALVLVKPSPL
jgi:hypothetical protein